MDAGRSVLNGLAYENAAITDVWHISPTSEGPPNAPSPGRILLGGAVRTWSPKPLGGKPKPRPPQPQSTTTPSGS